MTIQEKLIELGACEDARKWAIGKSIEDIWETCHRGDWMLWLFKRTNPDDLRVLTLAKAKCALTAAYAAAYAYAAYAATYAAAAYAAATYARKKSQQETADICRKYLPIPTI